MVPLEGAAVPNRSGQTLGASPSRKRMPNFQHLLQSSYPNLLGVSELELYLIAFDPARPQIEGTTFQL